MTVEKRNDWIIQNMKLIHHILKPYRGNKDYEDIVQQGIVGAICALDNLDEREQGQMAYIGKYVTGYVKRMNEEQLVHVPQHKRDVKPEVLSLDYDYGAGHEKLKLEAIEVENYADVETMVDFENAIANLNDRRTDIALMLIDGYNSREIGEKLGCSTQNINQHKEVIRKAVREYM